MPRVRLGHRKASEAAAVQAPLCAAGHVVDYDEKVASGGFCGIRTCLPCSKGDAPGAVPDYPPGPRWLLRRLMRAVCRASLPLATRVCYARLG